MSAKYEKLKTLLRELFQLDQPDLDFGIYRIMHARSAEIGKFLDEELLPQVSASFTAYQPADKAAIQVDLDRAISQAQSLGADPESLPKVKELRAKLANEAVDIASLEGEVYDHLYSFFRRYYSEGDFISKRVYKEGVYAIPYEGEEVKLHWANSDQYYIKTSEYLRDYAFRLQPDHPTDQMRVHFRLVDAAEGEHGNVKEAEGKSRVFILAAGDYICEENGELVIKFEYRPATLMDWPEVEGEGKMKPPAQKELLLSAEKRILAVTGESLYHWIDFLGGKHRLADGQPADYTRLAAHLNRYTARNTFDYFIHKDLGGFLSRELDFYIKNEVMHLDDVENESAPRVEQYLSKIKVIRKIAKKIIDFLAQLEDFQKKLWLKKKFVVETNYCITLDRIPEEFYSEIAANDAQREEWVKLFAIDEIAEKPGDLISKPTPGYSIPLEVDFLKAYKALTLDTKFFDLTFAEKLLSRIESFDEQVNGILVNSDNFHAINLLLKKYHEQIKAIYIDPPYNTDASEILYKNGYKHSCWNSLLCQLLGIASSLGNPDSMIGISIDDFELSNLDSVLDFSLGIDSSLGTIAVRTNPHGRAMASGVSVTHDYFLVRTLNGNPPIGRIPRDEQRMKRYPEKDELGRYTWINFRKTGAASRREDRQKQYYPIYLSKNGGMRIPQLLWVEEQRFYNVLENCIEGEIVLWPIDEDGSERVWGLSPSSAINQLGRDIISKNGQIYRKYRPNEDGALPNTWWDAAKYSSTESGTKVLKDLFGSRAVFDYPKSIYSLVDFLRVLSISGNDTCLDFFAGSGTTGHAILNLNREDGGNRKYILVEMGAHFDTALLPRIEKVVFSESWSDGKPTAFNTGVSHCLKYIRLESYEDTLNNLELTRSLVQQNLLDLAESKGEGKLKEDYTLRYLLDVESRGAPSLLAIDRFMDPTAYKLKVKKPGSDESREVAVDLTETFNYLIGLKVNHISAPHILAAVFFRDGEKRLNIVKGSLKAKTDGSWWFRNVTGTLLDGRRILVIWRKRPGGEKPEGLEQDNLVLDEWFKSKQGYSTKDSEFDLIYVNGTNNLENLKTPDDLWKVRLIEEDFFRLMFEDAGV